MPPDTHDEPLKLPPDERVELALALWESLDDADREADLALWTERRAELDRRWEEHLSDSGSAMSWESVRRRLKGDD